jgi:hypothetical protein
VIPSAEVCDNVDNNCNGTADESLTRSCYTGTAGTSGVGVCRPGTQTCAAGSWGTTCPGEIIPTAERCNSLDDNCNGAVDETFTGTCTRYVFATSTMYSGSMGGLAGADALCQTRATAAGLPGTYRAWLADGTGSPSTRFNRSTVPYVLVNGTTVANSWTDLTDGTLAHIIDRTELNGVVPTGNTSCAGTGFRTAWSAVNNDGSWNGAAVCSNWTSTSGGSYWGYVDSTSAWTSWCSGGLCSWVSPIYCFQQQDNCGGGGGLGATCTAGVGACARTGAYVCDAAGTGTVCSATAGSPTTEICDGIDNDCNGAVDDGALADAPPPNLNGCWQLPGNCCSFGTLQWCPPPGASCSGNGTLMPPCNRGTLACNGAAGWVCSNPTSPASEACDGIDNDCNGLTDDGMFPGEGNVCGSDEGECVSGLIDCAGGILDCVGDVGPKQEICDGKDNDCDGVIDNGIVVGGSCSPMYDMTLYPGPRDKGACAPGILECDGNGGNTCVGGQGPQPEVCDGIDNDCDGSVDETGPAPDGIDTTANPFPPPMANIGDLCGVDTGACQQGNYACVNGQFACLGGQGPQEEACDCNDNDCDGVSDEQDPSPASAICAPGNSCVKSGTSCLCASPCLPGEFPCPPGQRCEAVTSSDTGMPLGNYCVADNCGNCAAKTVLNADNTVLCAPAGTPAGANCIAPPVCQCKGQTGCKNPCYGVTCGAGEICTEYGADAGKCVPNNCYGAPCLGCDQVCHNGSCATNPCTPTSCPGQTCVPNDDFMGFTCVDSCVGKNCAAGEVCKNGTCVTDCTGCAADQVCDYGQMPPACVKNLCTMPCANGGCCDPVTGACGDCPCEGVVCPTGQSCMNGECVQGTSSSSSSSSSSSTSSSGSGSSSSSGGGGEGGAGDTGIWGLPTGGGGCSCDLGAKERTNGFAGALVALALGILRRRTTSRRGAKEVS